MRKYNKAKKEEARGHLQLHSDKMKKRQLTTKKPPTQRIIKDIRSLRNSGKSDIEIRQLLGIELRTFQRYNKTIYEQDQQVWFSITQEQLGSCQLRKLADNTVIDSRTDNLNRRLLTTEKKWTGENWSGSY